MKKILVITPGVLPVPAEYGGAVEKLIQIYLDENEKQKKFKFVVYNTDYNNCVCSKKYEYTEFKSINTSSLLYKISKILRYFINNLLPKYYIGNAYLYEIYKQLSKSKDNYDLILVENRPFAAILLRKIYPNTKIILHLHNDYLNKYTKKASQIVDSYDEIIAISNFIKSRINEIKTNNKVKVIYNGIDFSEFSDISIVKVEEIKKKYMIKKNDLILIYIGRLVKEKGLVELIRATNKIVKKYSNVKLLIIGSAGGKNSKENLFTYKLKKMANKKNIFFVGYVDYELLPNYYKIANVQIIPSKWDEPLGNVAIEGLYNEVDIISTRSGGLIEVLHESNSILVDKDHLKDNLYEAIKRKINYGKKTNNISKTDLVNKYGIDKYDKSMFKILGE